MELEFSTVCTSAVANVQPVITKDGRLLKYAVDNTSYHLQGTSGGENDFPVDFSFSLDGVPDIHAGTNYRLDVRLTPMEDEA